MITIIIQLRFLFMFDNKFDNDFDYFDRLNNRLFSNDPTYLFSGIQRKKIITNENYKKNGLKLRP